MDNYVTGKIIKELREKKRMTQLELADVLSVSDKTISKWETGKGLPDITLIEPLARALNVSVIELMNGEYIINNNVSSNMLKTEFYVCPVCGNIIRSSGKSAISCCGIMLPHLESEKDEKDIMKCDIDGDEIYVTLNHEMKKEHYISFIAYVVGDRIQLVKLYPEQNPETRFFRSGHGIIYAYCNKDGLISKKI